VCTGEKIYQISVGKHNQCGGSSFLNLHDLERETGLSKGGREGKRGKQSGGRSRENKYFRGEGVYGSSDTERAGSITAEGRYREDVRKLCSERNGGRSGRNRKKSVMLRVACL